MESGLILDLKGGLNWDNIEPWAAQGLGLE